MKDKTYIVVHPLDDQPEQKVDVSRLGPMPMTTSVKWSLFALRGYLVLMLVVVAIKFASAGAVVHAASMR